MTPQERFKAIRETLGLTQRQMAERLSFKPTSISGIETGGKNVSPRALALLETEFHVNPRWIEFGEEPQFLPESAEGSIDKLVKEQELTEEERAVLLAFVRQDKDTRATILKFVKAMAQSLSAAETPAQPQTPAPSAPEMTRQEFHEKLDKQIDGEKEGYAPSGSGSSNTA